MNFRIADTFTASPARLTGYEQKAAKTSLRSATGAPPVRGWAHAAPIGPYSAL